MVIITHDYTLKTKDDFPLDTQRWTMDSFVFKLGVAINESHLFGQSRTLNCLPVRTLFPEHNESSHSILLAKQVRDGRDKDVVTTEPLLRRIYQLGRSAVSIRCIPDYDQQLDQLQFLFSGAYRKDSIPAIKAIEGLVSSMSRNNIQTLEWYKQ